MLSMSNPSNGELFKGKRGKEVLQKAMVLASQSCGSCAISAIDPSSASKCDTEHIVDLQYIPQLFAMALSGVPPTGKKMASSIINQADFLKYVRDAVSDLAKAGKISSGDSSIMNDRLFNAIGSTTNRLGLIRTATNVNLYKGRVFNFLDDSNFEFTGSIKSVIELKKWQKILNTAVKYGTSEDQLLDQIRMTIAVWVYLNNAQVLTRLNQVRQNIYTETKNVATYVPGMTSLPSIMKEFDKAYFEHAAAESLKWTEACIAAVSSAHTNTLIVPGNSEIIL
ncbi:unnamed protein product [Penicillium viridicatum]